ncbi:MAG: flagellin-like protein [Candidatus Nanohaloarchaea archaeon]|jgi:flagellin-like protein
MNRKGITPVIAVVLLLLITVGAVASAYGLYQSIISDQSQIDQLNAQQRASQTNIDFNSVYSGQHGYINMDVSNTGQRAINVTKELSFRVTPDGSSSGLAFTTFKRRFNDTGYGEWNSSEVNEGLDCLQSNPSPDGLRIANQGGNPMNCNTTIRFPSATQTVGLTLNYRGADNTEWTYSCNPGTSDTISC